MVAFEKFTIALGIVDVNKTSPLRLVEINKETNLNYNTELEEIIEILMRSTLPEKTGMSIKELLDLPNYEFEMYYRAYKKVNVEGEHRKAVDTLLDMFKNMGFKK